MSIHVRQLEQYFSNAITSHIDVADLINKKEAEAHQATLSRALTAFAICGLTGATIPQASLSVLDGERDQGIDACYFDDTKNALVFVQSKWHNGGTKTISKGDLLKFLHGVKLVLSASWTTFSPKFKARKGVIDQALLKPDVSVIVAVAFTGDNKLGDECEEVLKQFETEQNSVGDFLETKVLDLRTLHRFFRTATLAAQPAFQAMLLDWGPVTAPHQAVYGRICCEELAKLYSTVGDTLFEPNIRSFLGDGEVNNQISSTLIKQPEDFWYFNNGITAICTKFKKTALGGGDNRQAGTFIFEGLQVVNGAQTIGSISKAYEKSPAKVAKAYVTIKVISLEGTPLGFTDTVTVATNRQNRVEEKDFLSLDANQSRVKIELLAKNVQYVFRSGEVVVDRNSGFDVTEAMIALACSSPEIGNAVLAKRNLGLLLDRKSSVYQTLFHSDINGEAVWKKVGQLRAIDAAIGRLQSKSSNQRSKQILTHGNRVISWEIFNMDSLSSFDDKEELESSIKSAAKAIDDFVKKKYPDAYLAVFFKNTQKCTELIKSLK